MLETCPALYALHFVLLPLALDQHPQNQQPLLNPQNQQPQQQHSQQQPQRLPLSYEHISRDGLYLLDTGLCCSNWSKTATKNCDSS